MIDAFHEDQLSERPFGVGLILKWPTQLLNGDISFQDLVKSGAGKQADPGEMCSGGAQENQTLVSANR